MSLFNHLRSPVTKSLFARKCFLKNPLGGAIFSCSANLWSEQPASQKTCGKKALESFKDPIRQVFISQSTDVFSNLALEDWLYRNHDFDHKVDKHKQKCYVLK